MISESAKKSSLQLNVFGVKFFFDRRFDTPLLCHLLCACKQTFPLEETAQGFMSGAAAIVIDVVVGVVVVVIIVVVVTAGDGSPTILLFFLFM